MTLSQFLIWVNIGIGIIFFICYLYQFFYLFFGTFKKPYRYPETNRRGKYAFCIAARNEESVIAQLCESIRGQRYPSSLIDIYVVADNCTDNTASIARDMGACVFERFDTAKARKGYALSFLFEGIERSVGLDAYDGYFIVDADNILDKNYVLRMNECISAGERVVMCYRNSKNFADSWVSAGYSIWFLRASRHLNLPRQYFGCSCEITGTGFFVCSDIIKKNGGWHNHSLIEDIEFTVDCVLDGERVAFCYDAIVYDEQPRDFIESLHQRKRWCGGYIQIMKKYGAKLLAGFFRGFGFSSFDMIMSVSPAFILSTVAVVINACLLPIALIREPHMASGLVLFELSYVLGSYFILLFVGAVACICERARIKEKGYVVARYLFAFPIFVFSFMITTFMAMLTSVEWKPIRHHSVDTDKFDR